MEFVIVGHYLKKIGYVFDISAATKQLMMDTISQHLLPHFNSKATMLEIWLDSNGDEAIRAVQPLTTRGKTLRYAFYLPYSTIVINKEFHIDLFLNEFFEALQEALRLNTDLVQQTYDIIAAEMLNNNEKYRYQPSQDTLWVQQFIQDAQTATPL